MVEGWGATCRNSTEISDRHLQIGHRWSDQHHPVCFRSSQPSVPGSIHSYFFVASVWNCDSSCPGSSLVIMWLSSFAWSFSIYKTAHRIWLRILSIVLEKKLKVLDCAWVSEWVSEVVQSCPTLCDPVDCSPPGSSVHGILQARILEWVAISWLCLMTILLLFGFLSLFSFVFVCSHFRD